MWALLILASCGPAIPEISPMPGVVPPKPTLFVIAAYGEPVTIEDAGGNAIQFTSKAVQGGIDALVVDAPEGTEFFVKLPPSRATKSRLGPWKVKAQAPPPKSAPNIETRSEFHDDGCPSAWGVTLSSSVEAPAYEYEFMAADGKASRGIDHRLLVGHTGCDRSTWNWTDGEVDVRLRPLFSDGSIGAWSNTLSLDIPQTPIRTRVARVVDNLLSGPLVIVAPLAFLALLSIGLGVAFAVRSNVLSRG